MISMRAAKKRRGSKVRLREDSTLLGKKNRFFFVLLIV